MVSLRALVPIGALVALMTAACAANQETAAAQSEPTTPSSLTPLTSLSPATSAPPSSPATSSSTTTLVLPAGPDVGDGTVCDLYDPTVRRLGVIASEAVREASGIAASRVNDAFWVVNDSGNAPLVHAVGRDGSELAAIELEGIFAFDWEAIAIGPGPEPGVSYLYIGDIGDNLRIRSSIDLLRFPEPDLTEPIRPVREVTTIRLAYPDSAHDSEAMWVDPLTGDVFLVTKTDGRTVVYRAAAESLADEEPVELVPVAEFSFGDNVFVTGADVTADGSVLAMRGYDEVWMWVRRDRGYAETLASPACMAPSPDEIQGEALTFTDGLTYVTVSEGSGKPLNEVSPAG